MEHGFIKGMDISSYPEMKDKGYKYYDYDGNEVELLDFAVSQGFNYGRLRIWNDPGSVLEAGGYCDLEHTKRMAQEIKKRGMGLLLDFHYSDFWADPGKQTKPKAWENLNPDELTEAVYAFTKDVLTGLDAAGAYPDMVQIGNEIRCGMLWPEGKPDNWPVLARLINAGIRAVRDTQKKRDTKVMIHLDQGGRYYYLEEWFDHCLANGVTDFDIIGLSYYAFWHGTYHDLKNSMEKLVKRYGRPLILAEIAHGYRTIKGGVFDEPQEKLAGFPASPEGQREALELIMGITANVSDEKGLGVFYWEPFCLAGCDDGSWGSCMGVVDQRGMPGEGLLAFRKDPHERNPAERVKLYAPETIRLTQDGAREYTARLPKSIKALRFDGNIERLPVSWNDGGKLKAGLNEIKGICDGQEVIVSIEVADETAGMNLVANSMFEDGFEQWEMERSDRVEVQIREKVMEEPPCDAYRYLYIKGNDKFRFGISQKIRVGRNGTYRFSLSYMGDNTTGVNVQMYIIAGGKKESCAIFPEELWHEHSVDMEVTQLQENGTDMEMEIGLIMDSPISHGAVKEIRVTRQQGDSE